MIDWLIFVPACFALNLAFGPNNLLAMTHGAQGGMTFALRAALGRLLVFIPMIAASAMGLGLLLTASAAVFQAVKLIGAAYLIWIGWRIWRSAGQTQVATSRTTPAGAFRAEALVALSNPKAILIFAAFFPQFVATEAYWQSYAMLGGCFLMLEAVAVTAYALAGRSAAQVAGIRMTWMQRGSGGMMMVFGALLLISPAPSQR